MDIDGFSLLRISVKTSDITLLLDVIYNVSEQTNLLAFNAAIKAEREGEQCRGFAVVADEVRSLARRTKNSANEIHQLIKSLVEQTELAVINVGKALEKADVSVQGNEETFGELASIVIQINSL